MRILRATAALAGLAMLLMPASGKAQEGNEGPSPVAEGVPYPARPSLFPTTTCPGTQTFISGVGSIFTLTVRTAADSAEVTLTAADRIRRPGARAYLSLDGQPSIVVETGTTGRARIGFAELARGSHFIAVAPYLKDRDAWRVYPALMTTACFTISG